MKMRLSISNLTTLFIGLSGVLAFAGYAVGEEMEAPKVAQVTDTTTFISDGSILKFDQDRASIMPIVGWEISPKSSGMSVVMKEIVKTDKAAPIDYSKPLFARNLTVMTINEASSIDETRAVEFEKEFTKMASKDGVMKDFQFTSRKFFNYKGENDGLVFFAQHTSNNFPMMQMYVLVSGESKQYLLTYTDLAANFSNPETYNAAWKSMTSLMVSGIAPKRYYQEAKVAGVLLGGMFLLVAPFGLARFSSQRRIKKMVSELQAEWDSGEVSQTESSLSNLSRLDTTRVATSFKKASSDFEFSDYNSLSDDLVSTRKSKFSQVSNA